MTSNIGSEYILENTDNSTNLVMTELRHTFKPEFLNRVDEIIIFNSLSKEVVHEIVDKIIEEVASRLTDKKIKLKLTEEAKKFIIENAYDEKYGARPIKRYISRHIESLLAKAIINDEIKFGSTITIGLKNGELILKED